MYKVLVQLLATSTTLVVLTVLFCFLQTTNGLHLKGKNKLHNRSLIGLERCWADDPPPPSPTKPHWDDIHIENAHDDDDSPFTFSPFSPMKTHWVAPFSPMDPDWIPTDTEDDDHDDPPPNPVAVSQSQEAACSTSDIHIF